MNSHEVNSGKIAFSQMYISLNRRKFWGCHGHGPNPEEDRPLWLLIGNMFLIHSA
jgi:hypothetical protein